ncbi:MAG: hypothetical protein ACO3MK_02880, partial [Candidatus Nanopelagicales bacterium]
RQRALRQHHIPQAADRVSPVAYDPSVRDGAQRTSRHRIGLNPHRSGLSNPGGDLSTLVGHIRAGNVRTDGPEDA